MNQEQFQFKLKEAAVLHNNALIQKRAGKLENYSSAIESYRKALALYTECNDFHNQLCENADENWQTSCDYGDTETPYSNQVSNVPIAAVNLELKVAQTLQSIAKLHMKLNEDSKAITTHEDAIAMLLEGKNRTNQHALQNNSDSASSSDHSRENVFVNINTNTPESKGHRKVSSTKTPPTVTSDVYAANNRHLSQCNITQLTNHERTRIISMSLASLAQIYFNREVTSKSSNEQYDLSEEEDALQYYQESLNFLKAVTIENPISTTNIPVLSNEKIALHNGSDDHLYFSSDTNQTPSLSETYSIDLRKDIVSILLSMATLYQERSLFSKVVEAYEQARDIRLLLNCSPQDQEMIESLLAIAYERNGQWEEALGCYQHVLKIRKGLFGGKSLEVGNLYASMSNLHRKMEDLAQSLGWNKRAVTIYQKLCDNYVKGKHIDRKCGKNYNAFRHLIGSLQNQGALYVLMNEVDRAIASYLIVVAKQVEFRGGDHPDVASTLNILGELYMRIDEFSEARESFNRALALYQKYGTGTSDPDMASTLQSLCEIEVMMGNSRQNPSRRQPPRNPSKNHLPRQPIAKARTKQTPKFTKPPPRPSVAEQLLEENIYCDVIETNPSYDDDDDGVSQITFATEQLEPVRRRDARTVASSSAKTYHTFEENLESWSPAELVFRAVEKVAIATEEFFIGPPTSRKLPPRPATKKTLDIRKIRSQPSNDVDSLQEGYEVREFESRIESETMVLHFDGDHPPNADNSVLVQPIFQGNVAQLNNAQNPSELQTIMPSLSRSRSHDQEVMSHIEDEVTSLTGSLAGTKFLSDTDDSVANGTQVSTLLGTDFLNGADTDFDGEDSENPHIQGEDPPLTPSVKSEKAIEAEKYSPTNASRDTPLIDEMLAQMNVITCDMEGDAKPFEEILKGEQILEKKESRPSPSRKDQSFEKLSACLDTLIDLKEKHGPDHVKVIHTMSKLADLYLKSGNDKGVAKYNEVLELQINKYGQRSTQVSTTYMKLGEYWKKQLQIDKAIDSFSKSKEIDAYLYGKNHPQIAQHLNSMGLAELDRNEYDMAMNYLQEALSIQKMNLGPNEINPDLSLTLVNIGSVYYKERNSLAKIRLRDDSYNTFIESGMLGKIAFAHSERGEYVMAMNFYREELELLKNRGDPSHAVAALHTCLGKLNVKAGRFSEAMEHHTQALNIFEQSKDNNALAICNAECEIGVVESHLGNFKVACTILENSCSVQRGILGNEQSRVARTMYHLAVIKRNQFKMQRSKELLHEALRIQMATLGKYNPETIDTQMEIAKIYLDFEKFDEALMDFESIFNTQKEMLGKEHPDLAWTLHFMGICYSRRGDNNRSMTYFQHCYRMQIKFFKFDSPAIASTMDQIGQALLKQGKLDKSFRAFGDAVRVYREVGDEYYGIALSLYNMGGFYSAKGKYTESLRCFKEAMRISVRTFGLDHPFIADIHTGVGNLNTRKCDFEEAKSEFTLALEIYKKCNVPENHSKVVECKKNLSRVEHEEALCV